MEMTSTNSAVFDFILYPFLQKIRILYIPHLTNKNKMGKVKLLNP
jgi:hypothetical protein